MLIKPPFAFAHCSHNLGSMPSTSGYGTGVTAGASNSDGSAVTLLSALAHDVHFLCLKAVDFTASGVLVNALLDILVDPAGGTSWASLIDDLLVGFTNAAAAGAAPGVSYYFPLFVPAGASIGARARNSRAANTAGRVSIWAYGEPNRPDMWWCGQRVESLGIDAANSKGTDITPGNSGAWGSWTSIGSPSGGRYGALQLGVQGTDDNAVAAAYHWQIGAGSNQIAGTPQIWQGINGAEAGSRQGPGWIPCDIAEGTQLQLRATCSTTAEVPNAALYGVH